VTHDADIDAARRRGEALALAEPRAAAARYVAATGRVIVHLTNGCTFAFPARALQGLAEASEQDLAHIEAPGAGNALHWEALDADVSVPGLLTALFGARGWMARELGRRGGAVTSPAKAAAARENGKKAARQRRAAQSQPG
jgi:hypothetical protein